MASRFIVYGRTSCPFCRMALDTLDHLGMQKVFFDFTDDQDAIEDAKNFYNWNTVPMILENNTETGETRFLGGFDDLRRRFRHEL